MRLKTQISSYPRLVATALAVSTFFATSSGYAQIGKTDPDPTLDESAVLYYDGFDYANDGQRHINPYAATLEDAFIFAHPDITYPGLPFYESNYPRLLENNHYAVVSPKDIFNGIDLLGLTDYSWPNLIGYGMDADGNVAGGAMVINAGNTPGVMYQREGLIEKGNYYKFTFDLFVANPGVGIRMIIHNGDKTRRIMATPVIAGIGQNASDEWVSYEVFFHYTDLAVCASSDALQIGLQNYNMVTSNNDYAIDNVRLVKLSSAPAGSVFIVNSLCATPPTAANDVHSQPWSTSTTSSFNVLSNDVLADGTTSPDINPWTGTYNSTFEFILPAGATLSADKSEVTVPGEGKWKINFDGTANFTPATGFIGNPTPIRYIITENTTGLSSPPATITVIYSDISTSPLAQDDIEEDKNAEGNYVVNIFTNDILDADASTAVSPPGTTTIQVVHPLNPSITYTSTSSAGIPNILIPNEGQWAYDDNGTFTFTPELGFTGKPSPLTYRFLEPTSNVWSNWANIIVGSDDPLPMNWLSFELNGANVAVNLTWSVVSETRTKGFDIERSHDGKNWSTIGFVQGRATNNQSTSVADYHFVDAKPITGLNMYRLKQLDFDGSYSYSQIRLFKVEQAAQLLLFPNPIQDEMLTVSGLEAGANIQIYDLNGRVVAATTVQTTIQKIDVSELVSGNYILEVINLDGTISSSKFVKK